MVRNPKFLTFSGACVAIVLGGVFALLLPGCSRDEEISSYEAPVDETPDPVHPMGATTPDGAPPSASPGFTYERPEGWAAGEVKGMRKAAFVVEDGDQKVEITVIDLAAAAGLWLPNVNIWRQQIQLGESTAEELTEATSPIEVAGIQGQFVELLGPEDAEPRQAILAVMAVRGPKSWFFKLKGDADLALAEKERFQQFVKSVKFEAAEGGNPMSPHGIGKSMSPPGGKPMSPHGGGTSPLAYDAPEGWAPGVVRGMRKAAFRVQDGDQKVEITAIDLAASAGDVLPNVNRWREQVKLDKVTEEELQKTVRPIRVMGADGHYVELLGAEDAERRQAILGAMAVSDGKAWFIKMSGDAELALREKERFRNFVKSIRMKTEKPPAKDTPAKDAPAKETVTEGANKDE